MRIKGNHTCLLWQYSILNTIRLWVLEKCSIYADGAIYNIKESLAHDEEAYKKYASTENKQQSEQEGIVELLAVKLRKKYFLIRVYLQHCAVLSQMGK